jgi:cytochrome c5
MSDAQHNEHQVHEGPIKTPKQLIVTIVASFVIPVVVIIMLTNFVAFDTKSGAGSDGMSAQAIARRIEPVGKIEIRDVNDPTALKSGEQVYQAQCAACHATGALNAPKFADEASWGPRLKSGYEVLLTSALKGKGSMPPQGGGEHSDLEIGRAVVYLANHAGGSLAEPAAPAAGASAPAAAASAPAVATAASK